MQHDVFISFSFQDQKQAEQIVNLLSSRYGISSWICTRDIDGGKRYKALIPEAIDTAKVVVFIQSENSLASKEIPKEIGMAFDENKTIIPFKLDHAKPQGDLRYDLYGVEYIDATIPSFEERVADLAKSIQTVLGTSSANPADSGTGSALLSNGGVCSEIFYGREELLRNIRNAFGERNTVFLRGMDGIGKSEIARQYAKRNRDTYHTVVFARYEDSLASLIADDGVFAVTGFARKLKENGTPQSDEEYARDKLNLIRAISDEHTLIILDNFDVTSDPMMEELTNGNRYHVLITSRCEPERGKYYVIPVSEIDGDTLRDMVIDFANPDVTMIDREDPAFPELFALTNRHTLTLELIAKYMSEKCIDDVGEMVEILKERHISALAESAEVDRYESIRALFRITALSEREKTFLRCLAMMPPSGVWQKHFRQWCSSEFSARARLAGLSLIKLDSASKTIALHPIVRQVILDDLRPDFQNCAAFLKAFSEGTVEGNAWNWPLEEKKAAANCADEIIACIPELNDETFSLYYSISVLKNFVQEYPHVIQLHRRLYSFASQRYGEDSCQAGMVAFRAGWFCKKFLLLDEATVWLEKKAYFALKNNAGQAFKEYPHCCTNLATLYIKKYELTGDVQALDIAERYIREADTTTREKYKLACLGTDRALEKTMYFRIAGVRMEQAALSMSKGNYEEAGKVLAEADAILSGYPNHHADQAYLSSKFAALFYGRQEYIKAIEALNRTLGLYEMVFQTENDYSLNVYIMLADCYEKTNEKQMALDAWQRAFDIADSVLVQDHPTLIRIADKLREKA